MSQNPGINNKRPQQVVRPVSKTPPKTVAPQATPSQDKAKQELKSSVKTLSDPKALGLTPLPKKSDSGKAKTDSKTPAAAAEQTGPTPERQNELETLIRSEAAPSDKATQKEMVDHAVNSGSPELKKAMLDKIPGSPDVSKDLENVGKEYQKEVFDRALKAYRDGKEDSPLFKLGELFHVQTLGAKDGEFQGEIDQTKLANKMQNLMETDEKLQTEMSNISQEVMNKWRDSPDGKKAIKGQTDFMRSDEFQQRLRLMSPEDRDKALQTELTKLTLLDPDQVSKVGTEVAEARLKHAQEFPLEGLANVDPSKKEQVLTQVMEQALGNTKTSAKVIKDLVKELSSFSGSLSRSQILARLKAHGISTNAGLNKGLGALSIIGLGSDLAQGKLPTDDLKTFLSQGAALNSVGAAFANPTARGLATLAGAKNAIALRSMPKSLKLLQASKAFSRRAPIIGDALGTLLDGHSAFESFSKGDHAKGATYSTAAGLGAIAMGLGIKAATVGAVNGWNPFGWAALGVGLTATGVGFAASQMDGKDEKLVKRLGLFDGAAAIHYAIDGAGTNDGQLIRALSGKSKEEMDKIRSVYKQRYNESLDSAIKGDTSGDYEDALVQASKGHQKKRNYNPSSDARSLERAMRGMGTDDETLKKIIMRRSPADLKKLADAFRRRTGGSLIDWVEGDTSGNFERTLVNQLRAAGVR